MLCTKYVLSSVSFESIQDIFETFFVNSKQSDGLENLNIFGDEFADRRPAPRQPLATSGAAHSHVDRSETTSALTLQYPVKTLGEIQ